MPASHDPIYTEDRYVRQEQSKIWGVGRIEVIRVWNMVERMLEEGHSVSSIHRSLQEKNVVSITRRQFDRIIRQCKQSYKISNPSIALSTQKRSPSPPPPRNPQQRFTETLSPKPQTFRHDPRPLKDYFAKGAGS